MYKCEKCGKEYKREDFYINHLKSCEGKDVVVTEEIVEIEDEKTIEEIDKEIFSNPELFDNIPKHKKPKKMEKIKKVVAFFDSMKGIRGLPQDKHTRSIVFALYNEYYGINQKDCSDCVFEDIWTALGRVYVANK